MLAKRRAVLEMPADAHASAAGGAVAYGGFWIRFLAYLADTAIIFLALLVLLVPAAFLGEVGGFIYSAVCGLGPILYFALMQASSRQASLGKELLGLTVAHAGTGARISFLRSLGRELAKIISAALLGIGFVIAAFTPRKQGLHDFIAATVIVREKSARVGAAIAVIVAGILIPAIALPLMLGAFLGTMLLAMMGGMMGALMGGSMVETAPSRPTPQVSQPEKSGTGAGAPKRDAQPAGAAAQEAPQKLSESDYDKLLVKQLSIAAEPSSARAGPALLHIDTFFSDNFWLKVLLPPLPNLERGSATVAIDRILDAKGQDRYDRKNTFETPFFTRVRFSESKSDVPHWAGTRSVRVSKGTTESDVQKIEGVLHLTLPVEFSVFSLTEVDVGKERAAGPAKVTLKSIQGHKAVIDFTGPEENYLGTKGYDSKGAVVKEDSTMNSGVSRTVEFKAPIARVDVGVASAMLKREYPFTLVRGQTAPAAGLSVVVTGQPVAAAAPAPAPAPKTEPSPIPAPKAEPQNVVMAPAPAPPVPAPAPAAAAKEPAPAKPGTMAATAIKEPAPQKAVPAPAVPASRAAAPGVKAAARSKPSPETAPSPDAKPKATRRAAVRKGVPPVAAAAAAPPTPMTTPRYNDVMSAVMLRDHAGVSEAAEAGSWVDRPASSGVTPLMVAAMNGDAAMTELLLGRGADPNRSAPGGSVLDYARKGGDGRVIDLLKRAGAR